MYIRVLNFVGACFIGTTMCLSNTSASDKEGEEYGSNDRITINSGEMSLYLNGIMEDNQAAAQEKKENSRATPERLSITVSLLNKAAKKKVRSPLLNSKRKQDAKGSKNTSPELPKRKQDAKDSTSPEVSKNRRSLKDLSKMVKDKMKAITQKKSQSSQSTPMLGRKSGDKGEKDPIVNSRVSNDSSPKKWKIPEAVKALEETYGIPISDPDFRNEALEIVETKVVPQILTLDFICELAKLDSYSDAKVV